MTNKIAEIALAIPKRQAFDYQIPDEMVGKLLPGMRVKVPYGHGEKIGIVVNTKAQSQWPVEKLKPILSSLDEAPLFSKTMLELLCWATAYYCHPIGDVLLTAIPAKLRKGEPDSRPTERLWRVADGICLDSLEKLRKAPKQQALLQLLMDGPVSETELLRQFNKPVLRALHKQDLLICEESISKADHSWTKSLKVASRPFASTEQALAISAINSTQGFQPFLIEGVTGSGKTEVYLQTIENQLQQQRQVIVLVPEISLTPQTLSRFEERFAIDIGVWHSGLSDNERLAVWQKARDGEVGIIIGTRSAVFLPLKWPGMIVVDEEHDSSFKQQDGFRYHARDLAIMRAKQLDIPLVLGSATPSLETLNNALTSRYRHLHLREKVVKGSKVNQQLLDIREQHLDAGLSPYLIERINLHLRQQQQVMIFINRRGYSPALMCSDCGYVDSCKHCDKPYTWHKSTQQLHCHHCGSVKKRQPGCQSCGSNNVNASGVGTEQLEEALSRLFPNYQVARVDSDSMSGKRSLNETLEAINQRKYQILVGTQILAKGHHFAHLSMVAILDVDAALYSADFRATEQLAQLITQVAGRTGRAGSEGEMWLQSCHPDNGLLLDLLHNGYGHFARTTLKERQAAQLPPFEFQILLKSESISLSDSQQFLLHVAKMFHMEQSLNEPALKVIGPFPSLMEKRQGRFRMQLLLSHLQRLPLHRALNKHLSALESLATKHKVRWSIDVDPTDFY
ncbi:primosomal protein N' [Planctobacterium marinum]|uniref:Replication restart protein PriA n=1 Tax=Planctobacterium marinum TaxID=1631968 RepID=A0AA48KTY2_9ALTE|nr:primosomal protein N' [Planctobacterium marinum]